MFQFRWVIVESVLRLSVVAKKVVLNLLFEFAKLLSVRGEDKVDDALHVSSFPSARVAVLRLCGGSTGTRSGRPSRSKMLCQTSWAHS